MAGLNKLRAEAQRLSESTANDELQDLCKIVADMARKCAEFESSVASIEDEHSRLNTRLDKLDRELRDRIDLLERQVQEFQKRSQ